MNGTTDALPPLPQARMPDEHGIGWFTAGQMHEYARAALAAAPQAPAAQQERGTSLRDKIGDLLGIGSTARTDETILMNLSNLRRRADCLSAIEREFFAREVPGEDDDQPGDECDLNWGADPTEYVEQFRTVLPAPAAQQEPQEPAKPLTEAQAIALWHQNQDAHERISAFQWFAAGIIAAERAHRITGEAA